MVNLSHSAHSIGGAANSSLASSAPSFQLPDWLHCNGCGREARRTKPCAEITYGMARCGHIYCSKCVEKLQKLEEPSEAGPEMYVVCYFCNKSTLLVTVNRWMGKDYAAFLGDPMELMERCIQQVEIIIGYQERQERALKMRRQQLVERQSKKARLEEEQLKRVEQELGVVRKRHTEHERQFQAMSKKRAEMAADEMNSSMDSLLSDASQRSTDSLVEMFSGSSSSRGRTQPNTERKAKQQSARSVAEQRREGSSTTSKAPPQFQPAKAAPASRNPVRGNLIPASFCTPGVGGRPNYRPATRPHPYQPQKENHYRHLENSAISRSSYRPSKRDVDNALGSNAKFPRVRQLR